MRNRSSKIILLTGLILGICSCNSTNDFKYEEHKNEYKEAINCLQQNYTTIFSDIGSKDAVSLNEEDLSKAKLCAGIRQLMEKHSIDYILCYRDSTIAFYEKTKKGIKDKQFTLIFANDTTKINDKLTSNIEIIKKHPGCYELEKIISLAD